MYKKNCKLLYAESIGNFNSLNQSYDGAIGMLTESKGDALLRPMDYINVDHQFVDYTGVFSSLSYYSLQLLINKKLNDQNDNNNLKNLINLLIPSFQLLSLFLAFTLLYLAVLCVFSSFKISRTLKTFSLSCKKTLKSENFNFKILSLSYCLLLFLIGQFFSCNLNVKNVIVLTDDLLYSKQQVLETNKEVCFVEASVEHDYFTNVSYFKATF